MSMSTHVIGIITGDDKRHKDMCEVHRICQDQRIGLPKEVKEYFNGGEPDLAGIAVNVSAATKEWRGESLQEGHEIDLRKLPPGVTKIRVYNSW